MKTVVITGSSKGLGYEMAKEFLGKGFNVMISGANPKNIELCQSKLAGFGDQVGFTLCDVRNPFELEKLWNLAISKWEKIDIWINNAGIGQKGLKIWETSNEEADNIFKTNISGTYYGTKIAVNGMLKQGYGKIYNTVGFGSSGMTRAGLDIYGTSKRAIAYLSKAFAHELKGKGIIVGTLQPGMMVTDFVKDNEGSAYDQAAVHKIYNILGDLPDKPAKYLVAKMISNRSNGILISYQSNLKVMFRFIISIFIKRDLFRSESK